MPDQSHAEDAYTDLLATLAASRELGSDMDRALVESYLQKHLNQVDSGTVIPARLTRGGRRFAPRNLGSLGLLAGLAIVIIAVIASGGNTFWLLLLPIALAWWWRPWSSPSALRASGGASLRIGGDEGVAATTITQTDPILHTPGLAGGC